MGEASSEIWIEKHRPKEFGEVIGQHDIVKRAEAFVKQKNMPHLLFAGPSGVGKTTLSLIIAKKLFGDDWHANLLELNASDARGIDTVRGVVKDFARTRTIGDVPFKIIYLDECDSLTKDAQQALRRTMENFSNTCRFILACNYSSKIIDPIQSRCTVFRFKPLEEKDIRDYVQAIAKEEKLKVDLKAVDAIVALSDGDARKACNILQSCSVMSKEIDEKLVYKIVSAAEPKEVKQVLEIALKKDFVKARVLLLDTMLKHGLSGLDIIKQIQKEIWNLPIKDTEKVKLIEKCGEVEFRMVEGSDEYVQLEAFLPAVTIAGGN